MCGRLLRTDNVDVNTYGVAFEGWDTHIHDLVMCLGMSHCLVPKPALVSR
jgi:hypothetical protein